MAEADLDAEVKKSFDELITEVEWRSAGHRPRISEKAYAEKYGYLRGLQKAKSLMRIHGGDVR